MYPNEHSAEIKYPLPIEESTTRRKQIAPGISIVMQRPVDDPVGSMLIQSYRFLESRFSANAAVLWLKNHRVKYLHFSQADGGSA